MRTKKFIVGLIALQIFFVGKSFSQIATNQLNINNVKATVAADGILFMDGYTTNHGYEVPKGSAKQALHAASLWIGGYDAGGNLHTAAMTYRQNGSDFFPGTLDSISLNCTSSCSGNNYNNIWEINTNELDTFLNYNYISPDINSWPGNGNLACNEGRFLAPFNDVNGDGIYSPASGDYPIIKGNQMLYWIMNDNCAAHTETGGLPFGIEVYCSAYAYKCDSLPDSLKVLNNTTFYHFKIINRNSYTYNNVHVGFWIDPTLGNDQDDLIGCNVANQNAYIFNSAANDNVYGSSSMIVSIPQLKGPLADVNDGVNNNMDSVYVGGVATGPLIDEAGEECMMNNFMFYNHNTGAVPAATIDPSIAQDYYGYLNSTWKDSTHLTYGNDGYQSGSQAANYAFPNVSDVGAYGTNFNQQVPWNGSWNTPSNYRFIMSSGPFTIQPGEWNEVEYAIIFSQDTTLTWNSAPYWAMSEKDVRQIRKWYNTNSFPSCTGANVGVKENKIPENSFSIFPNPAQNNFTVSNLNSPPEASGEKTQITIFDNVGKIVMTKSVSNVSSAVINCENLAAGIYFVQVSDQTMRTTKKLIIE